MGYCLYLLEYNILRCPEGFNEDNLIEFIAFQDVFLPYAQAKGEKHKQ